MEFIECEIERKNCLKSNYKTWQVPCMIRRQSWGRGAASVWGFKEVTFVLRKTRRIDSRYQAKIKQENTESMVGMRILERDNMLKDKQILGP